MRAEELKAFRKSKGKTQAEIAKYIGISTRQYMKYENGEVEIKDVVLKAIIEYLSGEHNSPRLSFNAKPIGDPVGTYKRNGNEFIELSNGQYKLKTKLVTQKAHLGYLTGWGDEEYIDTLPEHEIIVDHPVTGTYITFEAEGDSMDDGTKESIEDGDLVTGRKIPRSNWGNKLAFKKFKDFIIVCKPNVQHDGGLIVKRIIDHNTSENYILCHSLNPDKKNYPDFRIHMIDVMQIFNVVQITKVRKVR